MIAIENGYQVAVLAPTEILAAQHGILLPPDPLQARLCHGPAHRIVHRAARRPSSRNWWPKAWCTSPSAPTPFSKRTSSSSKLGLAIIDEQHRFGVLQRLGLVQKGVTPDVLVMTATPIPRTLAMTLYGDLDVSVIDELPPGRKPILTKHYTADRIEQAYSFMKKQIDEGRQAYVVYPVIEESETQAMKAAQQMYEHLSQRGLPGYRGRADARPARRRTKRNRVDAAVQGRADQDPGLDHGDRGRRGRAERQP